MSASKLGIFHGIGFLEATDAPNSSFVWKSLLAAQLILKKRVLLKSKGWFFNSGYTRSLDS